jgi:RNA polymerase sigma-70 factor (ECF subfamily)
MKKPEFTRVIEEYSNRIYGFLLRFLANREDAEDVSQIVFLSFYRKMETIDPSKYGAYLFRSAHNAAINYKKKKKRYVSLDTTVTEPVSEESRESEDKEKQESFKRAFKKLKPEESLAIELQFYQKKSYQEIAGIIGKTPQAVDSILVRAKRKLRRYLQDFED